MIDMKTKFTVRQALETLGGKYIGPEAALDGGVTFVTTDSRAAGPDGLFAAIRGERTDGHRYAASAAEKGAVLCVCEEQVEAGCPQIVVESTVKALQQLAAMYRRKLGVKVVGITGSVGKTTCKEVTASVLAAKYKVHKTRGNFNNEIGLPLTLLSMEPDTQAAVIEMGMSAFGEMELLSSIARPDMCVMTNIGYSHMENLGSQEGIFRAKCEIFEHMAPDAPAILNGDDRSLRKIDRPNRRFFGFDEGNDIRVIEYKDRGFEGLEARITAFGEEFNIQIGIPGRHVLYAVMAAIGVGLEAGLSKDEILAGISAAGTIGGRVNVIRLGELSVIDDCYNAAPASMEAGLDLLSRAEGRKVAILGDMFELGSGAAELHARVGAYAAKKNIDLLAAVGELSENMYRACVEAGGNSVYFSNKTELLNSLSDIVPDKGAVLIKASHGMGFSEIVDVLKAGKSY